jgi:hypothetical protein
MPGELGEDVPHFDQLLRRSLDRPRAASSREKNLVNIEVEPDLIPL